VNERAELDRRRAAFEDRSRRYLSLGFDRPAAAAFVIGAAGPLAGPGLDIGTGKGLTARMLARRVAEVVVSVDIDADEQALAAYLAAREGLGERIRFVRADASGLPFPAAFFGCAVMVEVLHHLAEPGPVLDEMSRVLRPEGVIILADFSAEGFELVARVHGEEGRAHPVSGATVDGAAAFLAGRGFSLAAGLTGQYHDVRVLVKTSFPAPPGSSGLGGTMGRRTL